MTNAAKKVIDDLGRVRAFAQTMLDCNTYSPNVHEMVRDTADNAIAFLKSQERYIEDLEQGVPVIALETLSERVKELESLLKAQEPRVMTLEEVLALPYDTPIYIENCDGLYGWDIFSGTTKDDDNDVVTGASWATAEYWSQDEYGDTWRCWTARPDQAKREATPWN